MTPTELKVLLLEDNPGDAFLIKFYLSESTAPAFNVSHAESVKAALDLLAADKFDIIISDMNLPDSFGVDTIKTILSNYPGNMLIVLTGLTDEEVGLETVRYGAQDFLVKGKFDGKVLVSSVMFAFERFKLNKQLDEENTRLETLQRLSGVSYFEIDSRSNVFCTASFVKIVGLPEDKKSVQLSEVLPMIANADDVKASYEKARDSKSSGECDITFTSGKKYHMRYEFSSDRICGTLQVM